MNWYDINLLFWGILWAIEFWYDRSKHEMLYHYIIICIVEVVRLLDDLKSLQCHAFIELWKVMGLQFAGIKPDVLVLLVGPRRIPKSVTTVRGLGEEKWEARTGQNCQVTLGCTLLRFFCCQGMRRVTLVILFDAHNQCTWSNALLCYSGEVTLYLVSHVFPKGPKMLVKFRSKTPATCIVSKIFPHDKSSMSFQHHSWKHMDEWSYLWLLCFSRKLIFPSRGRSCKLCIWCQQARLWAHNSRV